MVNIRKEKQLEQKSDIRMEVHQGKPEMNENDYTELICLRITHYKRQPSETPLVVQWLRICLPMQGSRVQSLVQKDPTCLRAAKPMSHGAWALEPVLWNKRRHHSEKPEHCNQRVAPAHRNWRKSTCSNEDSVQQKEKKKKKTAFCRSQGKPVGMNTWEQRGWCRLVPRSLIMWCTNWSLANFNISLHFHGFCQEVRHTLINSQTPL